MSRQAGLRRGRSALRAAALACAALALVLPPAAAVGADRGLVVSEQLTGNRSSIAYWTPERMRAAPPIEPSGLPGPFEGPSLATASSVEPDGPPISVPGRTGILPRAAVTDLETSPANDTVYPQRIHGKIFATLEGVGNFSCSGTVVPSPLRNLIVTAGHCVFGFGQNNDFATNFVFVPGYRNGNAPLGVWPATNLYTLAPWVASGAFSSDVGMARLGPVGGQQIETQFGSRGITFNQNPSQVFDHFGYPSRPNVSHPQDGFGDYDGERLIVCDDAQTRGIEDLGDGPSVGSAYCFMQQGSSGGGWVIGSSQRFVNSVVSHGYCQQDPVGLKTTYDPGTGTGKCGIFFGPYFGDDVAALWELATAVPPSSKPTKKAKKKKKKKCKKRKGKKRKKCKRKRKKGKKKRR